MSKQLLSIDDFGKGIVNDETKQITDGFVDMSGIDIWTEQGVAQINYRLEQDTTTSLTEEILSYTLFDGYIIAGATTKELWYNSSGTTWLLLNTNATVGNNNDLIVYQNYLIYASRTKLGRSTTTAIGGGFTDAPTWGAGSLFLNGGSTDLHFFKVFNNRLYISDGYALAELDGASDPTNPGNWIFTNNKFVLPVNEKIQSLEIISGYLAIGTLSGNFYLRDGASANASQIIPTSLGGIYAMVQLENTLFVFAGIDGTVYRYNGADLIPVIQIPNFYIQSNTYVRKPAVRKFKNGLIFCIPRNGIYIYNRVKEGDSFSLNKYGPLSGGGAIGPSLGNLYSLFITNISSTNDEFIIGYTASAVPGSYIDRVNRSKRYRLEEVGVGNTTVSPYIETQVYELRDKNGKPNKVQGVQGLFKDASNRLQVEYRLNNDTSYTLLGTIGATGIDIDKILRGIGKRVSKIQFRIKMGGNFTSTTDNTKLIGLKIF